MSKNLGNLMKQAQKMQEKLAEVQQGLGQKTVEAQSGGGMVTAKVSGDLRLVSLKVDKTVVNPEDVEMLEDLIIAAVNEGYKRAQEMASEEMGKVTKGLGLNIPGMF
ncbi:MAG: YbaB/EbfC family nucleoid-associated protein [Deltaproteobacteria bacterium]|nr:YbaB/EbfC family nucleoid-associated protein [Deltaproteobacteria bacterium]